VSVLGAACLISALISGDGGLPLAFVENRGQWDPSATFLARRGNQVLRIEDRALSFQLEGTGRDGRAAGVLIRLSFEGACPTATAEGDGCLPGRSNFFFGNDPARWRTEVPAFGAVRLRGLYAGTDLRVREGEGGFEYDLSFGPGADPSRVRVRCEGMREIRIAEDGSLLLGTEIGTLRQKPPRAWQVDSEGKALPVATRFRRIDPSRFGFEVEGWTAGNPLVIDPGVEWATFLGGSDDEEVLDVAVSPSGQTTVVGCVVSLDFPVTPGAYSLSHSGGGVRPCDVFVTRLDSSGSSLVYSTYLGGSDNDGDGRVAVDGFGVAIVAGTTESADFPVTPGAFDTTYNGGGGTVFPGGDVFVARLGPTGSALLGSTFVGGSDREYLGGLAVDALGTATIVGHLHSQDYPVTPGAFDPLLPPGDGDSFVTKVDPALGSLLYSSYFGETGGEEYAIAVAVDGAGGMFVAGATNNPNLPTTVGAFDTTFGGGGPYYGDGFAARLDPAGLTFSTYLGGLDPEWIQDVAVDPSGALTVVGETASLDFPTTPGAFDRSFNGGIGDAFIARLDSAGSALSFSTFLGGTTWDTASGLALDGSGAATVTGAALSLDFPYTAGAIVSPGGGLLVARLDSAGSALRYAGTVGGGFPSSISLDGTNAATVGGKGAPFFSATAGAYDSSYNGGVNVLGDGIVARFDLLPTGVVKYGTSTPSCTGPVALGVTRMPLAGDPLFAFTSVGTPPAAAGLLVVGVGQDLAGTLVLGISLHVDLGQPVVLLPILASGLGAATTTVPIPPGTTGTRVFVQSVWAGTPACGGLGTLSASHALEVTVQ
jgi:hypothetical protein